MARPVSRKGARKSSPKRKSASAVKSPAKKAAPAPKRPPEIPAKQWAKLGQAQRKRYAGFYRLHPGAPLYRARGKGKGEHLTLAQRREDRLLALAERQSYRGERYAARDADEIAASYRALIADRGWQAFNHTERLIRERKKGEGRITAEDLGYEWADYDGEDSELFYN